MWNFHVSAVTVLYIYGKNMKRGEVTSQQSLYDTCVLPRDSYAKRSICRRRVSLTVASPSRETTNRRWKGRGYVTWQVIKKFGCPIHISGMAEATALELCAKGDYIKGMTNHP